MKTITHLYTGLIIALCIYLATQNFWYSILFISTTTIIDIDHYLYYIFKRKSFNLIKAYKYFNHPNEKETVTLIFHTLAFNAVFFILSFFYYWCFIIFMALMLHLLLDLIDEDKEKRENKKHFRRRYY